MSSLAWPTKDPEENLDYGLDWEDELGGDKISLSTWSAPNPAGITVGDKSFTDTQTIIWLSGGTAGQKYVFTNTIVTQGGRTAEKSVSIKVVDK